MSPQDELEKLIASTDEKCEVRGLGHRNRFAKYRNIHNWLGLPAAILAALAAAVQTSSLPIDDAAISVYVTGAAVTLGWLVAILNSAITFVDPYAKSEAHRDKAARYDVLRSKMARMKAVKQDIELAQEIDSLVIEFEELQAAEPMLSDHRINYAKNQLRRTQ